MNKTFTSSKYYFNILGIKLFLLFFITNFYLVSAQALLPYEDTFEGANNWTFVNGTQTNKWVIGSRGSSSKELFITNDNGTNNNYSNMTSVVQTYRDIAISTNVSLISIGYAYNVRGNTNDYFNVWLVPQGYTPVAGTQISASSDRILFKSKQTTGGGWTTMAPENVNVSSFAGANMRLVFEWINNQDGTVNNNAVAIDLIDLKVVCAGTANPGNTLASVNPLPSGGGATLLSLQNATSGSGVTYQWRKSTDGITYTNIAGATASTYNATVTTKTFFICLVTCGANAIASNPVEVKVSYCRTDVPPANNNLLYIDSFKFVGTLNDNPTAFTSAGSGYSDFTNLTPVVKQQQGSVLNIVASAKGVVKGNIQASSGHWKAWVDFDGDGIYGATELVYSLTKFSTESLTFGFIIPSTTPIGKYRLRIKVGNTNTFNSCTGSTSGETEDYLFEVIADCSAKVNTASLSDGSRCGTGPVLLSATGTDSASGLATGIRWYANASGGVPLFEGDNYETDDILENSSQTFYVVAFNGSCESVFRIPVTATANAGPALSFGTVPIFCAATTKGQIITASNGKRVDILLNEKFNTGLGAFKQGPTESGYQDYSATYWVDRQSPYRPRSTTDSPPGLYEGLSPALSSGYIGGNFAMTNADYDRTGQLMNRMTLSDNLDTRNFDNLTLEFDLYYFTIITAQDPGNYFSVDYTLDGTTWVNLKKISTNQGNPNIWNKISLSTLNPVASGNNLPATLLNKTTLRFRLSSYSFGKASPKVFKESIAAVDNVKVFGVKDESSLFGWTSTLPGILYEKTCTTKLTASDKAASICVKPTDAQIENNTKFTISASASFSNGCPAAGSVDIKNDAKIWNSASNDWTVAANWKPVGTLAALPTIDNCVTVKTPLLLGTGNGTAKNITITTTGRLEILNGKTLLVKDFIENQNTAENFIVNSDTNILQTTDTAVNIGPATLKRNSFMKRQDYTYWGSPVHNQNLKAFSPSTLDTRFSIYNETTDLFVPIDPVTTNFIPGKGYAIRAPNTFPRDNLTYATFVGNFIGVLNNGTSFKNPSNIATSLEFPLNKNSQGYNLVANPYPSNIDFLKLVSENQGKINALAYFWTNINVNPRMQGSGYPGTGYVTNYATLNASAGTPATYSVAANNPNNGALLTSKTPNRYIKVGQGFIVQAELNDNLLFNNSMRTDDVTSNFFNNRMAAQPAVDRFWIQMTTPLDVVTTAAIAYIDGATDGFDLDYDAPMMGIGSDAIFTTLGTEQLAIQGKNYPLNRADIVQLSTSHHADGIYTIAIPLAEGIFNGSQAIYLKDNETGIVTNLSENRYSYAAVKGQSDGRFELFYEAKTVLGTDSLVKETLIVYREGNSFVVKSPTKKITDLEMFDSSGRLIYKVGPNNTKTIVPAESITQGVYILKINQEGEITTRKVMK